VVVGVVFSIRNMSIAFNIVIYQGPHKVCEKTPQSRFYAQNINFKFV